MSDDRLDLALLQQAVAQMREALAEYATEPARRAFRDSVVMHFIFTYELATQVIRRFVQQQHIKSTSTPLSELSFPRIVRRADDLGILQSGWDKFIEYRDARNAVAHTYSEQKAKHMVLVAEQFAGEAEELIRRVKGALDE